MVTWETLQFGTNPLPAMPVCLDALEMLLFKAGFVITRRLARTGPTMSARTVNAMLDCGVIVLPAAMATIPHGDTFNFHRDGDQAVCRRGISLANAGAAGANTRST